MPGWMAGQDAPGFFLDETVFRPLQRQRVPVKA